MSQAQSKPEAPEQVPQGMRGEPGELIIFNLRTLARFREERPYVQVLSDIGAARLVLFAFKAGQQLQEHRTSSQILVQALRGRVTVTAAGTGVRLQAGMVLQIEANVPHTVVAQTDAIILLTMTPGPSSHSLEREIFQDLTPLVTRTAGASEKENNVQIREGEAPSRGTSPALSVSGAHEEDVEHQEVSHVFHCMECDLQLQMDLEVTSHTGSQEIDEGVLRVRLDPRIRLERIT